MVNQTKKPHVHAECIKAWADGASIQRKLGSNGWLDIDNPSWYPSMEYRIKPEPKPDVVTYACMEGQCAHRRPVVISSCSNNWNQDGQPAYTRKANVKFTFDGETGELKKAEVIG